MKITHKILFCLQFIYFDTCRGTIAGITYIDDHNFGARYRNNYECDPFYWHPLHLPERCASIYENIIRSGLATMLPVRLVEPKEEHYSSEEYQTRRPHKKLNMQKKLLKTLYSDGIIQSGPMMGFSNIGPVALYHQPVSKKTGNKIKDIVRDMAQKQERKEKGNNRKNLNSS